MAENKIKIFLILDKDLLRPRIQDAKFCLQKTTLH